MGVVGASPLQCPTSQSESCLKNNHNEDNDLVLDMAIAGEHGNRLEIKPLIILSYSQMHDPTPKTRRTEK